MAGNQIGISHRDAVSFVYKSMTESMNAKKTGQVNKNPRGDQKLQRIINKFKAGRKLSSGEMAYLSKNSPEVYKKIQRILAERKNLEEKIEQAETKEEVAQIMADEMGNVEKLSKEDEFEMTARVNHFNDAYTEHIKTDEYQDKASSRAELIKQKTERLMKQVGAEDPEELRKRLKKKRRKQEGDSDIWDEMFNKKEANIFDYMAEEVFGAGLGADFEETGLFVDLAAEDTLSFAGTAKAETYPSYDARGQAKRNGAAAAETKRPGGHDLD